MNLAFLVTFREEGTDICIIIDDRVVVFFVIKW